MTATAPMSPLKPAAEASKETSVTPGVENPDTLFDRKQLSFLEKKLVERSRFRSLERALKTVTNR